MIPTLFGVTVVSFCIMQLAPGDPLLSQLVSQGAAGESSQTREAYLIQKRDLNLDKPLILNFRVFHDYRPDLKNAAYFRSRTEPEIVDDLARLSADSNDPDNARRLRFLRSFDIEEFDERLRNPEKRARLAAAIRGYVQVYCEDIGSYGVTAAIHMLHDTKLDRALKIGLIDCLNYMVVEAHHPTYSRDPSEDETPLVTAVWRTWWQREKDKFPKLHPRRVEALKKELAEMAATTSREKLFSQMERYDRSDAPFFAETLLGDSTLREKVICSMLLNLYVSRPLEMNVPHDAGAAKIQEVIENWRVHYEPRRSDYEKSLGGKLYALYTDTQYAHMVWRLATFQFGRSALKTREPVSGKIWKAVVVSAPLMLMSELVIYFVSIPLGITCAVHRGSWLDRLISLKLFFLYSVPPFVAAMLFLLFFSYGDYLKWFPMERLHSSGADDFGYAQYMADYLWHAFLPVTCLSLFSLAALAMYGRTSMLDVIGQDYIRTARAKGVPHGRVIYKHALRNALIPILTLFSNFLPAMLGGSVLIEYIFNIPGMGRLSWESIEQKDVPTLMALIYVQAIVVLLSILLTDILYVFVDPRISFESQGKGE